MHELDAPAGATWVRAEVHREDAADTRATTCDGVVGTQTTYCRNRVLREAMTSAIFLGRAPTPATGPTHAEVHDGEAVIGNGIIERRFSLAPFGTLAYTDRRTRITTGASPDLRLTTAGDVEITGADLRVTDAVARTTRDGGLALTLRLEPRTAGLPDGHVERTYTTYPGVAGLRVETTLALPGAYTGYTLDEVAVGAVAAATAHHFNAGYDWRGSDTPDWEPALAPAGGAHTGDHRQTTTGAPGEPIDVTGQWLASDSTPVDRAPSSCWSGSTTTPRTSPTTARRPCPRELADDLAYLGPFEGDVHLDNPAPAPVRARTVPPGDALALESVFTGLAVDGDDEPLQHFRYLAEHRAAGWSRHVTFNSNGVDSGRISTGAKDDMDFAEVPAGRRRLAARRGDVHPRRRLAGGLR